MSYPFDVGDERRSSSSKAPSALNASRAILEQFRVEHGDKRIALIHSTAIQNILNKKTPAAARNWKKALRGFFDHCLALKMIKADPLAGLRLAKMKQTGGFHTWTEDEIEQYKLRHAPGTKARLAFELLLQTGHARSDITRMGRQHVRGNTLSMRRKKTGVQFDIPMLPDLVAEIDPPKDGSTCLPHHRARRAIHSGRFRQLVRRALHRG